MLSVRSMPPSECLSLLGLTEPVSVEQIKQSYRRLAHHLHPDRNGGDEAAHQRFMLVTEAYRTLVLASQAVERGRQVGTCVHCGRFGEVARGVDGSSLCTRCVLSPRGGRLLPMPVLVVARCLTAIALICVAGYLLLQALAAEDARRVVAYSAAASASGLLSLLALAWTCVTVRVCLTHHERNLSRSYREAENGRRSRRRS
ncbi:MAG TPA: J domain-containing protein [Phycisphaerae bacterium]|nr:J domain-containing protein [Phycisphaerae bacterium]